jgi:hypothetical protein
MKQRSAQTAAELPVTSPVAVPRASMTPSNGTAPQPRHEDMKGHVSNQN